jgi:catechol 2,3-dioxygenase-like lactoylglutathione lyase family enzyme
MATVAAPDLEESEQHYSKWLGYVVRERGQVSAMLAKSWGAPRASGRPYILMSPPGWPDTFIRFVQTPRSNDYRPLTTFGWNVIEIVVDNPDRLRERLRDSPFEVIGEPEDLHGYPSIRAFQMRGSSDEVLYMTAELGDRTKSPLPLPRGDIGRVFIMVVAGPDIDELLGFYDRHFGVKAFPVTTQRLALLQKPQGAPPDYEFPITAGALAEHGNLLEFDGFSPNATARVRKDGELPPGVAMATFSVRSLEALQLPFVSAPVTPEGPPYGGRRAATVMGPAGELIELVEE